MNQVQSKVALRLMAGQEAEAVASVLSDSHPDATVERFPAYISVERFGALRLQASQVADFLGEDYDVTQFLVILSSYVGTIDVNDGVVTLRP
jgi:hypothetical protein